LSCDLQGANADAGPTMMFRSVDRRSGNREESGFTGGAQVDGIGRRENG
jgi:hypothetical protein